MERSYPKSHGQRKAECFPPTVMPGDSAGTAEALETYSLFKEGEGFPRGSFRWETEGFSSKQISLKAHFYRRLRNVWKPKTSDMQRALWHFTGQKSNKRRKNSLALFRKILSSRVNHGWRLCSCLLLAGVSWSHPRLKANHPHSHPALGSPGLTSPADQQLWMDQQLEWRWGLEEH